MLKLILGINPSLIRRIRENFWRVNTEYNLPIFVYISNYKQLIHSRNEIET